MKACAPGVQVCSESSLPHLCNCGVCRALPRKEWCQEAISVGVALVLVERMLPVRCCLAQELLPSTGLSQDHHQRAPAAAAPLWLPAHHRCERWAPCGEKPQPTVLSLPLPVPLPVFPNTGQCLILETHSFQPVLDKICLHGQMGQREGQQSPGAPWGGSRTFAGRLGEGS